MPFWILFPPPQTGGGFRNGLQLYWAYPGNSINPWAISCLLAASKARLGLDPTRHVKSVMIQQPDFSVRHWVAIQPFTDEEERVEFEQALLLAGLPP